MAENKNRASQYLIERCMSLTQVFDYFLTEPSRKYETSETRLVTFIAQIKYWDWEMDLLRHSFETFEERSKAWNDTDTAETAIRMSGLPARPKIIRRIGWSRISERVNGKIVAPMDIYRRTVETWNKVLDKCKDEILLDEEQQVKHLEQFGVKYNSIDSFRKEAEICSV